MSERFGPHARLRSRGEFKAVEAGGRRASGRFVTLVVKPNERGEDRLGIIASRKVGGAPERNRAKRRLREIFRRRPRGFDVGLDMVAIAKPGILSAEHAAVETDFLAALTRLRGAR